MDESLKVFSQLLYHAGCMGEFLAGSDADYFMTAQDRALRICELAAKLFAAIAKEGK